MHEKPTPLALSDLSGYIERITFHNEENGFCVLRVKTQGHKDLVTVVGNAINIGVGENIEAKGLWLNDKNYGLQFKAQELKIAAPTSILGIEKYLSSGMIKGIGPHFAKLLIKKFSTQIFEILDKKPHFLTKIAGIGEKRKAMILTSWSEQKSIREIMVFLQSHGIGTLRAVRIYRTYGEKAIELVRENPYRLAQDIQGIGFKTADQLAQNLGIPKDSLIRASAGLRYALQEFANSGHCAAFTNDLITKTKELLEISEDIISKALEFEIERETVFVDEINTEKTIFLAPFYHAEVSVAKNIQRIKNGLLPWEKINTELAIPWVEKNTGITLSQSQKNAISLALSEKISIITGGPGVGKTTIINSILKILKAKKLKIALCAPTGRAAKKLAETTSMEAKTIHRLLGFDPNNQGFSRNYDNPLVADLVILDEASMVDVILMNNLLKAIPTHASFLIVGDIDQLPSVGPGAILSDLIKSDVIATITLKEIFRQAANSKIITNAHLINQGKLPIYNFSAEEKTDFYLFKAETPEEVHDKLLNVVTEILPKNFGFDPLKDIQVLSPMNRGGLGSKSLNISLQEKLNNKPKNKISRFGWTFAENDKVIQNINNYDKDVFNGDIGIINTIDHESSSVTINFDDRLIEYDFNELDEISLAYAISIHKSQGSEYPAIVIPLAMQHYMMLARNLIYTGVTRGKKMVIIIGQIKALAMAVKNAKTKERLTNLKKRLIQKM